MGFNSAFKGLKSLKNPGNGRLNNLNVPDRPQCVKRPMKLSPQNDLAVSLFAHSLVFDSLNLQKIFSSYKIRGSLGMT